ncbi:MAG: CoA-binding protein [Gemmataceae bacterium]
MPSVAILGASTQPHKYGNRAVRAYHAKGYTVYPVNPHAATIEGLKAYPSIRDVPADHLDLVTLYLPPEVGLQVLDDIATKKVDEVLLNPGAESAELLERGRQLGLPVTTGCSILAIGMNPHQL